jgi:hypothetical protein
VPACNLLGPLRSHTRRGCVSGDVGMAYASRNRNGVQVHVCCGGWSTCAKSLADQRIMYRTSIKSH